MWTKQSIKYSKRQKLMTWAIIFIKELLFYRVIFFEYTYTFMQHWVCSKKLSEETQGRLINYIFMYFTSSAWLSLTKIFTH